MCVWRASGLQIPSTTHTRSNFPVGRKRAGATPLRASADDLGENSGLERVITPNDITSLFGNDVGSVEKDDEDEDTKYYWEKSSDAAESSAWDADEDVEDLVDTTRDTRSTAETSSARGSAVKSTFPSSSILFSDDANVDVMNVYEIAENFTGRDFEEEALGLEFESEDGGEEEQERDTVSELVGGVDVVPTVTNSERELQELEALVQRGSEPGTKDFDANEGQQSLEDYLNLDQKVTGRTRQGVLDSMSIDEKGDALVKSQTRVFSYNPTEVYREDRMKYGAYRRWQPNYDREDGTTKPVTKKTSEKDKGAKSKRIEQKSRDSFYNAIKKMGGPTTGGTGGGAGMADPPRNKRAITPNRPPTKKNRKKVITPDDIDSLFVDHPAAAAAEVGVGADYEDGFNEDASAVYDEGEGEGMRGGGMSLMPLQQQQDVFNPMMTEDEETPQWLLDADKAEKERKRAARRKRSQATLTDDWRFWAAIIAGLGFVSAAFNIYQQTGGAAVGGRSELII